MSRGFTRGRLGDVCRVLPGFAFKSNDWTDHGIPVVKIKNIGGDNTVNLSEVDCVAESLLTPKLQKFVLKGGDILLAMTGATAGKVGKVRTQRPALLNQRVAKIEPVSADPHFIWAVVSSEGYQKTFFHLADGAAQPNMSGGQIEGVEIPLPPLPIQRRIGSILSAYDDLIENNTRRIAILEEMARALYREWFVDFRQPGHEKVKMVESPLGPIPAGWKLSRLGEMALNFDRKRKPLSKMERAKRKGPYPYYGAAKVFDYIDDFIFDGEYLLVAEDGSVVTTDGKPVLQLASGKFWANNHTHILQGRAPLSTHYLYLVLGEVDVMGYVTGAAQPKITQENLNRIPVLVPESGVLERFQRVTADLFQQMNLLEAKNANLRTTRDLLLPKLISGEIDVSNIAEAPLETGA